MSEDLSTAPADAAPAAGTSLPRTIVAVLLGWIVPGAGHVFLGNVARGLLFGIVILVMFAVGLALEGQLYVIDVDDPLTSLAAIAGAGVGAPYLLVRWSDGGQGDVEAGLNEYGTAFALTAGLLNLLVVLDAYDVAGGRRP